MECSMENTTFNDSIDIIRWESSQSISEHITGIGGEDTSRGGETGGSLDSNATKVVPLMVKHAGIQALFQVTEGIIPVLVII
jgi:hypothetical protein